MSCRHLWQSFKIHDFRTEKLGPTIDVQKWRRRNTRHPTYLQVHGPLRRTGQPRNERISRSAMAVLRRTPPKSQRNNRTNQLASFRSPFS